MRARAGPGKSKTSFSITLPSSPSNLMVRRPLPGPPKSVALYWSPKAWRPTTIGAVQPGPSSSALAQPREGQDIEPRHHELDKRYRHADREEAAKGDALASAGAGAARDHVG